MIQGNIPLSIIPIIYLGTINLFYLLYALFWGVLAKLRLARPMVVQNEPKRIMQEMERAYKLKNNTESQPECYQDASSKPI